MDYLPLLFSVIAIATAAITIIALIAIRARNLKVAQNAIAKTHTRLDSMADQWQVSLKHMQAVESKLDRMIELLEREDENA